MATTTTNFGWDIPQSTDLVKDGATAIAALGQDIDTALVDLKGGTTGQILSKASNTDLDYTWINNDQGDITEVVAGTGISGGGTSGSVTITNSMATAIDAKGDLIAGTGADTFSRLAVGTNDQVLIADSTTATGLKWGAAPAGGMTVIATGTLSGATFDISSIPGTYNYIQLVLDGFRNSTAGLTTYIKMNNTTAEGFYVGRKTSGTTYNNSLADNINPTGGLSTTDTNAIGVWTIYNYASASIKKMIVSEVEYRDSADSTRIYYKGASINTGSSSAITSIRLDSSSTWSAGTYTLYGVK